MCTCKEWNCCDSLIDILTSQNQWCKRIFLDGELWISDAFLSLYAEHSFRSHAVLFRLDLCNKILHEIYYHFTLQKKSLKAVSFFTLKKILSGLLCYFCVIFYIMIKLKNRIIILWTRQCKKKWKTIKLHFNCK